ncbi:hypothetical protein [Phenylobacterium sp.]|jgi:hypothetical protein|uniref:hypothetical protein n=1 Tax=Phenylobacterium sp. TaxID=1871053 RepID=UPI002F40FB2A
MRRAVGLIVWAAMAGGAAAQVDTPPDCHWVAVPARPSTIEMWCRGEDGRATPTGRLMRQASPNTWDGCPRGKLYDGARCVTEARALAAAGEAWASAPPPVPGPAAAAAPANRPRVLMFQDRRGRRGRGMACIDQDNATICKPIPRH